MAGVLPSPGARAPPPSPELNSQPIPAPAHVNPTTHNIPPPSGSMMPPPAHTHVPRSVGHPGLVIGQAFSLAPGQLLPVGPTSSINLPLQHLRPHQSTPRPMVPPIQISIQAPMVQPQISVSIPGPSVEGPVKPIEIKPIVDHIMTQSSASPSTVRPRTPMPPSPKGPNCEVQVKHLGLSVKIFE